jgi:hypothetical protein
MTAELYKAKPCVKLFLTHGGGHGLIEIKGGGSIVGNREALEQLAQHLDMSVDLFTPYLRPPTIDPQSLFSFRATTSEPAGARARISVTAVLRPVA